MQVSSISAIIGHCISYVAKSFSFCEGCGSLVPRPSPSFLSLVVQKVTEAGQGPGNKVRVWLVRQNGTLAMHESQLCCSCQKIDLLLLLYSVPLFLAMTNL